MIFCVVNLSFTLWRLWIIDEYNTIYSSTVQQGRRPNWHKPLRCIFLAKKYSFVGAFSLYLWIKRTIHPSLPLNDQHSFTPAEWLPWLLKVLLSFSPQGAVIPLKPNAVQVEMLRCPGFAASTRQIAASTVQKSLGKCQMFNSRIQAKKLWFFENKSIGERLSFRKVWLAEITWNQ